MKIAVFVDQFPSTSETFVLGQVAGLLDRGHDVRVFSARREDSSLRHHLFDQHSLDERTEYYADRLTSRLAGACRLVALACPKNMQALRALNPLKHGRSILNRRRLSGHISFLESGPRSFDVVYCHFGPNGKAAEELRRARLLAGPLVTVFHAYDLTRFVQKMGEAVYKDLFARGELFVAITRHARDLLLRLGCPEDRIVIAHAGVDTSKFKFREPRSEIADALRVLMVGRLMEKKGFAVGIRGVAAAARLGCPVSLKIVGDGPLRPQLEALQAQLIPTGGVEFLGQQTHEVVQKLTAQADVLLVPSVTARDGDEEGLPAAVLEGLASGTTVIATNHAGIPEVISNGETGYLAPEGSHIALAEFLLRARSSREECRRMAVRGRALAERDFDTRGQTSKIELLLKKAAAAYGAQYHS